MDVIHRLIALDGFNPPVRKGHESAHSDQGFHCLFVAIEWITESAAQSQADPKLCATACRGNIARIPPLRGGSIGIAALSFDDVVGNGKYTRRNCQAKRFRGPEIDNKLELGGLLHR